MKALAYHAYDDTRTGFIRALAYIDISLVALESRKLRQSPKLTAYRIHMDEQHWTHLGKNVPSQGIGLVSLHQDLLRAAQQFRQDQQISCLLAQGFGLPSLGFHVQQQVFHRAFPKAV